MSAPASDLRPRTQTDERLRHIESRATVSALWLFVLLNFIFRDLHEIVKADFLADALDGVYNGQEVSEALFLLGGVIVEVPIALMLAAWVLPFKTNRWLNVILAPLFGAMLIPGAGDLDDYFHFGLMLVALGVIVTKVWRWGREPESALDRLEHQL